MRTESKVRFLCTAAIGIGLLSSQFLLSNESSAQTLGSVTLATLHLNDGSKVEFLEAAPGELVVTAQVPSGPRKTGNTTEIDANSITSLGKLSPLEKYNTLSGGRQAPPALVNAQKRSIKMSLSGDSNAARVIIDASMRAPKHFNTRQSSGLISQATNWFQTDYCDGGPYYGGYEFSYCFLYRTGDNGTIVENGYDMHSAAYPYFGNVRHAIEYWSCGGSWCNSVSRIVTQGWVSHIWSSGSFRYRRGTLRDAVGDGFHWAVYGDKDGIGTWCPHGGC